MTSKPQQNAGYSLSEGSISVHLYRMTLPMVWGLLANFSIQFIDMLFIAQLGDDALTAIGFAFPIMMLVLNLSIGLSAGVASIISRKAPVYSETKLRSLVSDIQLLSLAIALAVSVLGFLTIEPVFLLIGAPERLLPLISGYMKIYYLNSICLLLSMQALSSVRAMGDSRLQASSMITAAVINLILDPLLIFGLWGFPRLELEGAALATLIARLITLGIAYQVLAVKYRLLALPSLDWQRIKKAWGSVASIALPAAGTNMIIPLSGAIITALLASFGDYAVAGLGVALRIEPLMLIMFYSLSAVISPFSGQNLAAKKYTRIMQGVRIACFFSMLTGILLAIIMWLFAKPIVALFTQQPDISEVAIDYLWIVPISFGAAGVVMIINASFNGIARPFPATWVSLLRVIILYLPLAYIGAYLMGIEGIFYAYSLVNILAAGVAYFWFMKIVRRLASLQ